MRVDVETAFAKMRVAKFVQMVDPEGFILSCYSVGDGVYPNAVPLAVPL